MQAVRASAYDVIAVSYNYNIFIAIVPSVNVISN
jgi:hypothetical protein